MEDQTKEGVIQEESKKENVFLEEAGFHFTAQDEELAVAKLQQLPGVRFHRWASACKPATMCCHKQVIVAINCLKPIHSCFTFVHMNTFTSGEGGAVSPQWAVWLPRGAAVAAPRAVNATSVSSSSSQSSGIMSSCLVF